MVVHLYCAPLYFAKKNFHSGGPLGGTTYGFLVGNKLDVS